MQPVPVLVCISHTVGTISTASYASALETLLEFGVIGR